jgi:hypothetical protein
MDNSEEKGEKARELNRPIADFIVAIKKQLGPESKGEEMPGEGEENIEEAGESVAKLYEKVRNLIEYKDDHLIKRNAIERILKRNLLIELRRGDFSAQFIEELAMAGYLDRALVGDNKKEKTKRAISKYQKTMRLAGGYETKRWLVELASCEMEEILFPNPIRFALVGAMYRTVRERIIVQNGGRADGGGNDIRIFLATVKSIAKADNATLNWALFKIYFPEWMEIAEGAEDEKLRPIAKKLPVLRRDFGKKIADPVSAKIGVALRKQAVFFNIFYEVALQNVSKIDKIAADPESLKFAVQLAAGDVYDREMKKYWKRVKRSLVFLIVTKIFLAAAVEYPYDLYIVGQVAALPILVNLFFPPIYLLFLSLTVHRPSDENSALIAKGVEEISFGKEKKPIAEIRAREIETFSDWTLNLFFILTYGISFGIAVWILRLLDFNWLGVLIFLFLFSVINFFNALVRQPVRELLVEREKEGMIGMLIDTLSMPFVRIGKWMSVNFSRVNVFIFLFDVIIEAPFKVVIRFIREWAGFIRRKKEEMI